MLTRSAVNAHKRSTLIVTDIILHHIYGWRRLGRGSFGRVVRSLHVAKLSRHFAHNITTSWNRLFWNERLETPTVTSRSLACDAEDFAPCVRPRPTSWLLPLLCRRVSPPGAAAVTILGWWGGVRWGGGAGWGLDQFHVVGWEHSEVAVRAVAPPPALVDHLDARDDFIGIEWDLGVVGCGTEPGSR